MTRIIMNGCNGHMGQVISNLVKDDADAVIVAGADRINNRDNGYPVFNEIGQCDVEADVVIDFSAPDALDGLLDYCMEHQLPVVLCSTGLSEQQLAQIEEASKKTAVLKSANMSLGINTLLKLIQDAAKVLAGAGFDMEVVEKHHRLKKDAPSGTALALADSLNDAMGNAYHYVYDRSQKLEARDEKDWSVSSPRRHHCGRARRDFRRAGRGGHVQPYSIFQGCVWKRRGGSGKIYGRKENWLLSYE